MPKIVEKFYSANGRPMVRLDNGLTRFVKGKPKSGVKRTKKGKGILNPYADRAKALLKADKGKYLHPAIKALQGKGTRKRRTKKGGSLWGSIKKAVKPLASQGVDYLFQKGKEYVKPYLSEQSQQLVNQQADRARNLVRSKTGFGINPYALEQEKQLRDQQLIVARDALNHKGAGFSPRIGGRGFGATIRRR